jgi:hypothetical protein
MLFFALLLALRLTPAAPDAPLKQPQMAVEGKTVNLTYGAGNAVYFARSEDAGKTFSQPVRVAEPKALMLGMHRGPRIALAGKVIVITAIGGEAKGKDVDLLSWRSTDGGKTWSEGTRVNDVPTSAREGLHGLAAGPNGVLWTVWLDLREKGMRLMGSISTDAGKTWQPNQLVYASPDGHICECCHPTAYVGPKGELYAMWRNWLSGSRDMYYAVSTDRKTWSSHKLGEGTWPLKACPMDGGGLALDGNGAFHSAWRRDGVVYATGADGKEVALGPGKNPTIAANRVGPYVAWTEGPAVKLMKPGAASPVILGEGAFPVLAASDTVYVAWEHEGAITVEPVR